MSTPKKKASEASKAQYKPKRGADQATITFSLSKEMKRRIEEAAIKADRPLSSFVRVELEKVLPPDPEAGPQS